MSNEQAGELPKLSQDEKDVLRVLGYAFDYLGFPISSFEVLRINTADVLASLVTKGLIEVGRRNQSGYFEPDPMGVYYRVKSDNSEQ